MIVALIGLEAGIIDQGVYVVLVLMSLLQRSSRQLSTGTGSSKVRSAGMMSAKTCIDEAK
ncbi:MAG: hypothetical protein STSR0009_00620 [Methanoregula sp.]